MVCETVGIKLTDAHKRSDLIENLNPRIFESIITIWASEATRKSLPTSYRDLKGYIINDYSNQTTRADMMKIILGVARSSFKKQELIQNEPARMGKEGPRETDGGKEGKGTGGGGPTNTDGGSGSKSCFICGKTIHLYKICYHFDKEMSVEENEKAYEKNMADKKKQRRIRRTRLRSPGSVWNCFVNRATPWG